LGQEQPRRTAARKTVSGVFVGRMHYVNTKAPLDACTLANI